MNIVDWARENLDFRGTFLPCYLNINGETEACQAHLVLKPTRAIVVIERENKDDLEVYLSLISSADGVLYYFEQDNGIGAALVIPRYEGGTEFDDE